MIKKSAPRLGQQGIHDVVNCMDSQVRLSGFISGADNVDATFPRELFILLRSGLTLIHYGLDPSDALGITLQQGKPRYSHIETNRRRALAFLYAMSIAERDDLHDVIAEEIGQGPLATIGNKKGGYSARQIKRFYTKYKLPWDKCDPDLQDTLRQYIDHVIDDLREFHDKQ